jgi:hypothetical protein
MDPLIALSAVELTWTASIVFTCAMRYRKSIIRHQFALATPQEKHQNP